MSQAMEYIEYLSREIGARPAGTEEEQQAALYITERLQNDSEFPATIEDFTGSSNLAGLRMLCSLVAVVFTIIAMIVPILAIPAFILAALAAAAYVLETFGSRPISRALARGASQNVVAKYQPDSSTDGRRRKVVLVAHYDTGKVTPPLVEHLEGLGLPIGPICAGALCLNALLLLVRAFAFSGSGGVGLIIFNIITIIVLLVVAIPAIRGILYRIAPYNEGANNNAAGVAAVMEAARRISFGSVSEADLAELNRDVVIHGVEEAYQANLVPEGAQIVYEASQLQPPNVELMTDEDRLAAAKAAVAAFTGQPVPRRSSSDIASKLVGSYASSSAPDLPFVDPAPVAGTSDVMVRPVAASVAPSEPVEAPVVVETADEAPEIEEDSSFENVPDWFAAAQRKAKRTSTDTGEIQRSRYAEAMDAAEREREARRLEREREEEEAAAASAAQAIQDALAESAELPWEAEGDALAAEADGVLLAGGEEREALADEAVAFEQAEEPAVDLGKTVAFVMPGAEAEATEDVRRRPIVLPALDGEGQSARTVEITKQRAPLAEAADDSQQAARSLLTMLPTVEDAAPAPAVGDGLTRSGMMRRLRADLPSLSGAIKPVDGEPGEEHFSNVSTVGSFGTAGSTGAFAPVAEELAEELEDEEVYVDDADDSDFEDNYTETGAFAGPGYVEMPKSRVARFFDRFRKHDEELEETPQEWLDVDESFDPRAVGRERGGWESFREDVAYEDIPPMGDDGDYDDYDEYDEYDEYDDYDEAAPAPIDETPNRRWQGGGFSRVRLGHVDMRSAEGSDAPIAADMPSEELEPIDELGSIYHFRNPDYNTEVWFVLLGSEVDSHDGITAFMDAHHSELRGAMIIDVEALASGELSVVQEEGVFKRIKTSSRIKRYVQKASSSTGLSPKVLSLRNAESSASIALKNGMQAVRLIGAENGKPALAGSSEDVVENLDEETLERNIDYLMELIRYF